MNQSQAIKIACEIMVGKRQSLKYWTFDANTAQMVKESERTPHQKNAVKNYKLITEAIATLEAINAQGKLF